MDERFKNLFIFEVANNHQGSVAHGKKIIDAIAEIAIRHKINGGLKFQFRDLATFIHPDFRDKKDVKHIPRFLSTELSTEQFTELVDYTKEKGLIAIATPFDEVSVQQCLDLGIEILKVASCSALDWPLLEAIAAAKKPVVVSSGGLKLSDIDKVVSFFMHKEVPFALMHCVGVYPTPDELLNLSVVRRLIRRYPGVPIGYSGHESPDDVLPAVVSMSEGATLLERHVGVEAEGIKLNAYSMNPAQTEEWVKAALRAQVLAGDPEKPVTAEERDSLRSLMRGTYARRTIKKGEEIKRDGVLFSMPLQEGQLTSGEFGSYRASFTASRDYAEGEPVIESIAHDPVLLVRDVIHQAKGMLNEAGVTLGGDYSIELSHHYGMEHFRKVGATIVNMVNREYCKKIIVVLPGQRHPPHKHEKKEETFEMLWGDLTAKLDDEITEMKPGDRVLVKRNTWHSFWSRNGAIFEEISTTHYRDDSHYEDPMISRMDVMQRKTIIEEQI